MEGLIFRILRYIFEIVFGFTSSFWRAQVRGILARIFYYHLFFLLLRFIINELSLRLIKIQKNKISTHLDQTPLSQQRIVHPNCPRNLWARSLYPFSLSL